jgi:hypothetical protein
MSVSNLQESVCTIGSDSNGSILIVSTLSDESLGEQINFKISRTNPKAETAEEIIGKFKA